MGFPTSRYFLLTPPINFSYNVLQSLLNGWLAFEILMAISNYYTYYFDNTPDGKTILMTSLSFTLRVLFVSFISQFSIKYKWITIKQSNKENFFLSKFLVNSSIESIAGTLILSYPAFFFVFPNAVRLIYPIILDLFVYRELSMQVNELDEAN